MPSIVPSYIYTLFASVIVGALIIGMCGLTVAGVKAEAEKQQLSSIASYVAAKSMKLISCSPADNLALSLQLDIPPLIGNQRYWVQIQNDSSSAWVETSFGATVVSDDQRALIPSEVIASGSYVSGSGPVFLKYHSNSTGLYLILNGGN